MLFMSPEVHLRPATMGKIIVTARMESQMDLLEVAQGRRAVDDVRSVEVADALVDTDVLLLGLPKRLIDKLGLLPSHPRTIRMVGGTVTIHVYHPVRLTVQERDCDCEVMELDDDLPVLVGRIPLQALDFVIDPTGQRLVGGPEHGGRHMIDIL
jgi:predicted aspartyl protease